jgi:hypothetical protein
METTMRLPKDPENWTGIHAKRALAEAWRLFDRYEANADFSKPQEWNDRFYRPYQLARELAVEVARYTRWMERQANLLP